MKTRQLFVVAIVATAFATILSCTKEDSGDLYVADTELSFTACFPEGNTRTAVDFDGTRVVWRGNESINVFTESGQSACFTSSGTGDRETAVFTGSFNTSTDGETFYAVYPYNKDNTFKNGVFTITLPSQQTAVEGSFDDNLFPSIAISNGNVFQFYHACSGIRFRVAREDIERIVITAMDNTNLAGGRCFVLDESGKPQTNGFPSGTGDFHSVTLIAPEGTCLLPDKYYYAILLPTWHKVSITFCLLDGTSGTYYPDNDGANFQRAVFRTIDYLDVDMDFNGPQAVDLGLDVKWASCNLGATEPEEYGDYFAWGETEPKDYYDRSAYSFAWNEVFGFSKYNNSDNIITLDAEDDAATVIWGDPWRMPTEEDFADLIEKCTWTRVSREGAFIGYTVTSEIEGYRGSSIFLPAAGYMEYDILEETSGAGLYWSSSLSLTSDTRMSAVCLHFLRNNVESSYWTRSTGLSIRPVLPK